MIILKGGEELRAGDSELVDEYVVESSELVEVVAWSWKIWVVSNEACDDFASFVVHIVFHACL